MLTQYGEFVKGYNCTHGTKGDLNHHVLSLAAEAGEVAGYLSKLQRGKDWDYDAIVSELGDVLFHLEALCQNLSINIEQLKIHNMEKLKGRKERGTLVGNGDKR